MTASTSRLGTDLALTIATGVPSAQALDTADSWHAVDLASGARRTGIRVRDQGEDLQRVEGRAGLAQALVIRLLTPLGDLAHLGHPAFGSRLVGLIGRLNDEATRNLARRWVIEAIAAEPRVRRLDQLTVRVPDGRPDVLEIALRVEPVTGDDPLSVVLEVAL